MAKTKARRPATERVDLYQQITDKVVAALEAGAAPWHRPWAAKHLDGIVARPRRHNGQPYQGINVVLLWFEAAARGYVAPTWMTYRQAQELGGQVRKGEKGTTVVFANRVVKRATDEATGEEVERVIPILKAYTVFNVEQIDDLPERFHGKAEPVAARFDRIAEIDAWVAQTGARVREAGQKACYWPGPDAIDMPPFATFRDAESFYATLCHELVHWTGAPHRLNRDMSGRFKTKGYAMEELVAEMGAAFLCADLGLSAEPRPDHAAYIATWLAVLKQDKRAVFTAATAAQRAAEYLHGLQDETAADPGDELPLAA